MRSAECCRRGVISQYPAVIPTATPDTTEQSCLRRVWRGAVNWLLVVVASEAVSAEFIGLGLLSDVVRRITKVSLQIRLTR